MVSPKRITDNRDPRTGLIVVLLEVAADYRTDAQYTEKVRRHLGAMELFRITGAGERDVAEYATHECGHTFERVVL